MKSTTRTFAVIAALLAISLAGCPSDSANTGGENSQTVDPHAGHAHPQEGPHGGDLIELGNEEYHAELLHDQQSVTIYVLNASADQQVPIEASEITINTTHNGSPAQFSLSASPDENDPPGKSSRFVSDDTELTGRIDMHDAEPRLVLSIDGKSYRGEIEHNHAGQSH